MTMPQAVLWDAEPHTRAKHEILRRYLDAWFPILATHHKQLVYFDGFAGPGRYRGGEEGSPLIALNAARRHFGRLRGNELIFVFVEEDRQAAQWLRTEISRLKLPTGQFKVHVIDGECQHALAKLLDALDKRRWGAVPTFALLDPFGVKGLPFTLVARLLQRRACEVLITFMTFTVQRWHGVLPQHINALVGDPHASTSIANSANRAEAARVAYQASLSSVARFVRFFCMRSHSDQPLYDLFFATQNDLGFLKMKQAMWDTDKSGHFKFSDASDPSQTTLFPPQPELELVPILLQNFRGRRVVYEEIERFVVESTIYLPTHAKKALQAMAVGGGQDPAPKIVVDDVKRDGKKRRGRFFSPGTFVTFTADRPKETP